MLSEQLTTLVDQMRVEQDVLMRLAENQVAVTPVLERLAVMIDAGHDDVTRAHIRNTDANVGRLIEEMTVSRERLIGELRDEIRLVARTIAAVAESDGGPRDAVTVRQVR